MKEPMKFAGRVVQNRFGKTKMNDYPPVEAFFNLMNDFYGTLDGIPYSAVEELEKYEMNRDVMVKIVCRIFKIMDAAKLDFPKEYRRIYTDPFEGLEDDVAKKKETLKITGDIKG